MPRTGDTLQTRTSEAGREIIAISGSHYVRRTHVRETEIEICQTGRRPISCQSTLAPAAVVLEVRMGQSPHADLHVFLAPTE